MSRPNLPMTLKAFPCNHAFGLALVRPPVRPFLISLRPLLFIVIQKTALVTQCIMCTGQGHCLFLRGLAEPVWMARWGPESCPASGWSSEPAANRLLPNPWATPPHSFLCSVIILRHSKLGTLFSRNVFDKGKFHSWPNSLWRGPLLLDPTASRHLVTSSRLRQVLPQIHKVCSVQLKWRAWHLYTCPFCTWRRYLEPPSHLTGVLCSEKVVSYNKDWRNTMRLHVTAFLMYLNEIESPGKRKSDWAPLVSLLTLQQRWEIPALCF